MKIIKISSCKECRYSKFGNKTWCEITWDDIKNEDVILPSCTLKDFKIKNLEELAHEIWAATQLMPMEGIEDGVERIVEILKRGEEW